MHKNGKKCAKMCKNMQKICRKYAKKRTKKYKNHVQNQKFSTTANEYAQMASLASATFMNIWILKTSGAMGI